MDTFYTCYKLEYYKTIQYNQLFSATILMLFYFLLFSFSVCASNKKRNYKLSYTYTIPQYAVFF